MQQGDVLGPALYCSGQHAVNVCVADANPNVHSVGYLDNNHLCGQILDGLKAAAETVDAMRADLDLEVNLDSSWIFVPEWLGAGISTLPPEYAALFPTLAHLPVVQEGVKILGVPTGTDAFVADFLEKKEAKITSILPHLAALSDGKVHFQAVKFCVLPKFHFLLRALPPSLTLKTAEVIDNTAISAVCCYGRWDREAVVKKEGYLNPHKFILQLPHRKGGLALTPLAGRALPAHYAATSFFLRWVSQAEDAIKGSLAFALSDVEQSDHEILKAFRASHCRLLHLGAIEDAIPPPRTDAPSPATPLHFCFRRFAPSLIQHARLRPLNRPS